MQNMLTPTHCKHNLETMSKMVNQPSLPLLFFPIAINTPLVLGSVSPSVPPPSMCSWYRITTQTCPQSCRLHPLTANVEKLTLAQPKPGQYLIELWHLALMGLTCEVSFFPTFYRSINLVSLPLWDSIEIKCFSFCHAILTAFHYSVFLN